MEELATAPAPYKMSVTSEQMGTISTSMDQNGINPYPKVEIMVSF